MSLSSTIVRLRPMSTVRAECGLKMGTDKFMREPWPCWRSVSRERRAWWWLMRSSFARDNATRPSQKRPFLRLQVRISVRLVKVAMASTCPYANDFALAYARICAAAR
jgi:hypothetical protein